MRIEGKNSVRELINSGKTIEKIEIIDNNNDVEVRDIVQKARDNGIKVEFKDKAYFARVCQSKNPQGICAVASDFVYSTFDDCFKDAEKKGEAPLFILLDGLEDPHNLGSVLRVADCTGACGVVIPKHRSVCVNETVVRVSAGASEHVNVVKVNNINQAIEELKKRGVWVYAFDMDGQSMYDANLTGPIGIIIGSEGNGVSSLVRKNADGILSIKMNGKVNSLNASVSAGVALYEVVRQRGEQWKKAKMV
ncbi:MAG: 23S rRNA (guanosine(2251)-2'-O)-methyltransferase RlmB [Clostridia bacterium]